MQRNLLLDSLRPMLAVVILLTVSCIAGAADFVVVANTSIAQSEVSSDDLKQIFLGSKTSLAGAGVEPVLGQQGTAHEAVLGLTGKSDTALRNHFKSLVFTGKGAMPKAFPTDVAIVQYVAKTKGAIGYISPATPVTGVKQLAVK